jgi:hypothetical protein
MNTENKVKTTPPKHLREHIGSTAVSPDLAANSRFHPRSTVLRTLIKKEKKTS